MIKSRLRARAKKMIKSNAQEQEQEEVDLKEAAFVLIKTKIEQSQHINHNIKSIRAKSNIHQVLYLLNINQHHESQFIRIRCLFSPYCCYFHHYRYCCWQGKFIHIFRIIIISIDWLTVSILILTDSQYYDKLWYVPTDDHLLLILYSLTLTIINHSSANFAAALLPSMMILPSWKIPCSLRRRVGVLLTLCLRTKVAVQVMDGRVTLGMIMICTCTRHFMIAKRNALMLEACVMGTSMTIGVINARCGRSSLINTGWNTFMAWTATSKPPTSKQWSWKNRRRWLLYSSDDLLCLIENVLVWIDRDVRDKLENLLAKIIFLEGMVSLSLSIAKDVSSITWGFAHTYKK